MSEKDKKYIELSMHSMMVFQRYDRKDNEITITGMIPEREILAADSQFNVPCEVVMIPKREFEKLHLSIEGSLESWKRGTGCKYPAEARILLEKWKTLTKCETPEAAATWITSYESACERGNRLAKEIEDWQKATGCKTPEEAKSRIEGLENAVRLTNETMQKELEKEIDTWQRATGCETPEEAEKKIKSYLLTTLMF